MAFPQGHQAAFTMFDETALGSDPGTPDGVKLYLKSNSVAVKQGYEDNEALVGRTPLEPTPGVLDSGGTLVPIVAAENLGKLLKHTFGTDTPSGTGPYVHALTIGALPVGFLLEQDLGAQAVAANRYEKLNGLRIGGMKFGFSGKSKPTLSFDVVGIGASAYSATPLDATITDNGCTEFGVMHGSVTEGGSAFADITEASVDFANNLNGDEYAVGSAGKRASISEGMATVSGEITAMFKSMDLLTKAINNTETSLKFILQRGTGAGSAGNEYLDFELATLVYERRGTPVEGPGGVLVKLGFKGYGANALKCTLKNTLATL